MIKMSKKNLVVNRVGENATIQIFEEIGDNWWYGYSLQQLMYDLSEVTDINVQINSIGGNYFEALSIANYLKLKGANTTIVGLAASAATIILYAGKKCTMPKDSWIMIHNPTVWNDGDADSMQQTAEFLTKITEQATDIYYRQIVKNGKQQGTEQEDKDRIKEMMKNETWMNGEEALNLGFIDELIENESAITTPDTSIIVARLLKNVKCSLRNTPKNLNISVTKNNIEEMDILKILGDALQGKTSQMTADEMVVFLKSKGFTVTAEAEAPPPAVVVETPTVETPTPPPAVVENATSTTGPNFDEAVSAAVAKLIAGATVTNAATQSSVTDTSDDAKAKAEFAKGFVQLAAKLSL